MVPSTSCTHLHPLLYLGLLYHLHVMFLLFHALAGKFVLHCRSVCIIHLLKNSSHWHGKARAAGLQLRTSKVLPGIGRCVRQSGVASMLLRNLRSWRAVLLRALLTGLLPDSCCMRVTGSSAESGCAKVQR